MTMRGGFGVASTEKKTRSGSSSSMRAGRYSVMAGSFLPDPGSARGVMLHSGGAGIRLMAKPSGAVAPGGQGRLSALPNRIG